MHLGTAVICCKFTQDTQDEWQILEVVRFFEEIVLWKI